MADLDLCKGDPGVTKIILDIAFKALVLAPVVNAVLGTYCVGMV